MRAVVQRVSHAQVQVADETTGRIDAGLLVLLGVATDDTRSEVEWLVDKIVALRIFENDEGKFDRSLLDTGGALLVVSQFTLLANARKGTRPSFTRAAHPDLAAPLYEHFVARASALGIDVQTGRFGASMDVTLTNRGPVTIVLDTTDRR